MFTAHLDLQSALNTLADNGLARADAIDLLAWAELHGKHTSRNITVEALGFEWYSISIRLSCPYPASEIIVKATEKHVLFCRTVADRKVHLYPVSVHANQGTARAYAVMLNMAHRSGDAKTLKELDPEYPFGEGDKIHPDTKWSVKVVPYEPTMEAVDPFAQETKEPATT